MTRYEKDNFQIRSMMKTERIAFDDRFGRLGIVSSTRLWRRVCGALKSVSEN